MLLPIHLWGHSHLAAEMLDEMALGGVRQGAGDVRQFPVGKAKHILCRLDSLGTDVLRDRVFISAVANMGLDELKDVLWRELNAESNKLAAVLSEDTLVHRDKDMTRFAEELAAEGEDEDIEYIDEEDLEDIEDFEDFEYEEEQ